MLDSLSELVEPSPEEDDLCIDWPEESTEEECNEPWSDVENDDLYEESRTKDV